MSVDFQNEAFNKYFFEIYGERWSQIYESLKNKEKQTQRRNSFFDLDTETDAAEKVSEFYTMDPASIYVAQALDVQPEDLVLDMCAAPGGKTLILAEALKSTGILTSNEFSNTRRERLLRVVREYIPYPLRQNIFVTGKDGNMFGKNFSETFDKILADVPCSGERHLLENKDEFLKWTKRRSENLAVRQFSLLSSAYIACKTNGTIVYSTCSISPIENDHVIKKLIKRRSVKILQPEFLKTNNDVEKTEFGYQVLPDKTGFGPMYFAVLKKSSDSTATI